MAVYRHIIKNQNNNTIVTEAVECYLQKHDMQVDYILEETESTKAHWNRRMVGQWLEGDSIRVGDNLIIYEAADLARSTCQMLEILMKATTCGINIHFVKYDKVFEAKEKNKLSDMLELMQNIESDFISRRTTDALARRRAAGLPLGRPIGRKNKSLKLDKYRKDILKYLELGISKASIAKLVDCHPQTLYDWMERHGIEVNRHAGDNGRGTTQVVVKNLRNAFNVETQTA